MSSNIKQVIVIRTDLNMRKGKMVAQGCHASLSVFIDNLNDVGGSCLEIGPNRNWNWKECVEPWLFEEGQTKICVGVNSEKELIEIFEAAKKMKIPTALIKDAGKTEFNGVPTYTCCAIGPDFSSKIDKITGNLKLL